MAPLLAVLATLASVTASLDDTSGLVQREVTAAHAGVAAAEAFDCKAHPDLCREPFNCQDYRGTEPAQWEKQGVGGVDFKTWCQVPTYGPYVRKCISDRDPVGAGELQFILTKAGLFGVSSELDGSACFLEGHCVNEEVNNSTTWEQAVQMCDKRFGPKRWRAHRAWFEDPKDKFGEETLPKSRENGFTSRKQTTPFLIAACAMGNFHCDVMYCKETYCKDPHFQGKYSHLLKEQGWVS